MLYRAAPVSEFHKVRIRGVAHGGAGIGEEVDGDGRTWFVHGALPDELVEAEIEHEAKRFFRARAVRVLEPSALRVEPPCPLADACGGCGWQFVDAAGQAELKRKIVADQLRRLPVSVDRVVASPQQLGYRRRARLHYERAAGGGLALGFHRVRSRDVVDVPNCPVLTPELDATMQKLRTIAELLPPSGEVLGISDGRQVVLGLPGVRPEPELEAACEGLLDDVLVGVVLRGGRRRRGIGTTQLQIDGGKGQLPTYAGPFVFAQAQREQNAALVDWVVRGARPQRKRVLELYAGNGNFTRGLARHAVRVWAFDDNRDAIGALRQLAAETGLSINAKQGGVEATVRKLASAGRTYDVVVLDPPRGGLGKGPTRDLARLATQRIVYVSCDPSTLARDLEVLVEAGFAIEDLCVFDMMPMTSEVETAVILHAPTAGGGSEA
jgi:23S rRNA (uracil1939-C5)-methyltransferase